MWTQGRSTRALSSSECTWIRPLVWSLLKNFGCRKSPFTTGCANPLQGITRIRVGGCHRLPVIHRPVPPPSNGINVFLPGGGFRHSPNSLELSGKNELVIFTLTFLTSTWYIKNPFLKAKLVEVAPSCSLVVCYWALKLSIDVILRDPRIWS